jgi:hypothetical protein
MHRYSLAVVGIRSAQNRPAGSGKTPLQDHEALENDPDSRIEDVWQTEKTQVPDHCNEEISQQRKPRLETTSKPNNRRSCH